MGARTVPVHYLRGNAAERSPKRVAVFDCETRWETLGDRETHTLRLWHAEMIDRRPPAKDRRHGGINSGDDAPGLARTLSEWCRTDATLWVYAHNLGFDLSVSGLPYELSLLGWELTDHALASDQPWARMRRGNYHLVLADSGSLFRVSEKGLAELLYLPYVELPKPGAPLSEWRRRCANDVCVLCAALRSVMDWWDREAAGNWTVSGPGLGWNLYRHKFPPLRVVIDPDPDARALERDALYSGFGTIRQQGNLTNGPYADIDFRHAYLTLAATQKLPVKRGPRFESLSVDDPILKASTLGVLARCHVRCGTPRYPVKIAGHVWHPIGEFWTTLAGPEIADARQRGELLAIGPGYPYSLSESMGKWGRWLTQALDAPDAHMPRVLYPVLKAWSRSVLGRWAVRTGRVIRDEPDPRPGWHLETGEFGTEHLPWASLTLGGRNQWIVGDQESDNAFPAVLAWLQSWTRLLLCRVLDDLEDAVEVANTDGVIINLETLRRRHADYYGPALGDGQPYRAVADDCACGMHLDGYPLTARVKRISESITVLSPMHVLFGGERVLAGIPADATPTAALTYQYWTWPGFRTALREGSGERYTRQRREVNLGAMKPLGWKEKDGTVVPALVMWGRDAPPEIEPYLLAPEWFADMAPAEEQHPLIQRIMTEGKGTDAR